MNKAPLARLGTLRWRLTLFYCGLLAVLLAAAGLFVYSRLETSLRAATETQLRNQANLLANEISGSMITELYTTPTAGQESGMNIKLRNSLVDQRLRQSTEIYVALLDAKGQPLITNQLSRDDLAKLKAGLRSNDPTAGNGGAAPVPVQIDPQRSAIGDLQPNAPTPENMQHAAQSKEYLYTTPLQRAGAAPTEQVNGLVYLRPFSAADVSKAANTSSAPVGYLMLATSLAEGERTLNALAALLVGSLLAAVLVAGLLGLPLARVGLRPLTEMAATAARIGQGDLARRVHVPGRAPRDDEVRQLAVALNGMLDQIGAAFAAQQRSEARTRQFAADASHELRSPLTVLGGYLDVLLMGAQDDPVQTARILRAMQHENERLSRLVVDLLLLTRIDANGAASLRRAPLPVAEVITRAVENMRLLAGARTLATVIAPPAGDAWVAGDADHLYRVLINLLDNAIRYTGPAGQITVTLDLAPPASGAPPAQWVRLRVADDGCGIAPDELPRIFDRFYRADASRARQTGNAGLGLAIAKSIVDAHGGALTVTSTPGSGACFTILLRLCRPPATGEILSKLSAGSQGHPSLPSYTEEDKEDHTTAAGGIPAAETSIIGTRKDYPL